MSDHVLVRPASPTGTGVLVVAGSSGRVDAERAQVLGDAGALALSIRWFGGDEQPPAPVELPLETFTGALDLLASECDRLVVMGLSFGAEAMLQVAALDDRVSGCVAFAPSAYVWAGVRDDGSQTSHWSHEGAPVPFLPYVDDWVPADDPPAFRDLYEVSMAAAPPDACQAATIRAEQIRELVLVSGGDDQVWPSTTFAEAIVARRRDHGLATTYVTHPAAGHRAVLPGERPIAGGVRMARGGTPEADAELGRLAWQAIEPLLHGG